ncbi:MAG: indolepyruvate oxidoreductase subunit beta [Planctomycetota bacterium]|nr:MAG: indolepyruvate oxidoreductase subunit beta [Planctomycetota bacterium]
MQQNIILAGVGGQGILTIARAISSAAVARGYYVKQSEVHGMSQRGGAVQSHLRISDEPLHSDLIPSGRADVLIATEPLESLRYVHLLGPEATIVASGNAFLNIGNYPPVEQVIDRITSFPHHIVVNAEHLAKSAGSARASNVVLLGAASSILCLELEDLEQALAEMFGAKGTRIIESNVRALHLGRQAARAYLRGLERGGTSREVRHWIDSLSPEQLESFDQPGGAEFALGESEDHLSGAEAHAVERLLWDVYEDGRSQLFEHEVYQIVQLVGAISPPHHVFLGVDDLISEAALEAFPGERVVLKIVSPDVVHKSDVQGVVFCAKNHRIVTQEIDAMIDRHRTQGADVRGVLVVEFVERSHQGLGEELFVGIRSTREFGPIIAAGLGGVDTEYLARVMQKGAAVAKAVATDLTGEEFFELFQTTAAYEMISGKARGHKRVVSDGELVRCFRAFIALARRFCVARGEVGPDVGELEVNPFSFRRQCLVPLDGRGRLASAAMRLHPRPIEKVARLLEPTTLAVLGVSSKGSNFGRIILRNVLACGFETDSLRVIKKGERAIDGVACVPSISELPTPADLLVIAAGAEQLPAIVDECVDSGKVHSAIIIPGGAGETEGSEQILEQVRASIARGRERADGGPVFLGPNCLGVLSRPGRYDTFFIPDNKLDKRRDAPGRGVAMLSQSGAFIVSRMSRLERLDPTVAVSIGNQADLTIADLVRAVGQRNDIHTLGIYVEGFNDVDGLDMLKAIRELTDRGRTVVLYKAGRTEQGRGAAAGHTASVAGDYEICEAGALNAGAMVAETFAEFEQLLELSACLHDRPVRGTRIGAISNAGFETVGMADRVKGRNYQIEFAPLDEQARAALNETVKRHRLDGLINIRNPLDLTPMASEEVYDAAARALLASEQVDALLVSAVPLTPALATTQDEIAGGRSLADVLGLLPGEFDKPVAVVIDAGSAYEALVLKLREAGLAVFRSADQAMRSFGMYLCHRVERNNQSDRRPPVAGAAEHATRELR